MIRRLAALAALVLLGCGNSDTPVGQQVDPVEDSRDGRTEVAVRRQPSEWEEPLYLSEPEVFAAADLTPVSADEVPRLYSGLVTLVRSEGDARHYREFEVTCSYRDYIETNTGYGPNDGRDSIWLMVEPHPFFEQVLPGTRLYFTPEDRFVAARGASLYRIWTDLNILLSDCGMRFQPSDSPTWIRLMTLFTILQENLYRTSPFFDVPPEPVLPEVTMERIEYFTWPERRDAPLNWRPGTINRVVTYCRVDTIEDIGIVLRVDSEYQAGAVRVYPTGGMFFRGLRPPPQPDEGKTDL